MIFFSGNNYGPNGTLCGTAKIPVSKCTTGICRYTFNLSQASPVCQNTNSNIINVNVYATNLLGNGQNYNIRVGETETIIFN